MSSRPAPGIRLGTVRDLAVITALELRCFGEAYAFPRRTWRYLLGPAARQGSAITVVHDGLLTTDATQPTVLGAATGLMRINSRVLRLYSLAVDASQRGQGLGRRLIAGLVAAAPERCESLSLEVHADNRPARGLYESLGMRMTEELPGYYPDGADASRYRAPLTELKLTVPGR